MSNFLAFISQLLGFSSKFLEEVYLVRASGLVVSLEGGKPPAAAAVVDGGVECCVCLSSLEEGGATRMLPCCHLFHRECVDRWLALRRRTCPLCRLSIEGEARRKAEEELTEELVIWFSSFHVPGF